ncbi:rhodanese-like domain-containing protein [Luteibacter sp. UNCMF366Tsu5.1]|uniref:rhodanese-like domain-containing protein n=1 Tax=Luteibacter sp. UNCMF366Tsu5.1 TaxID=1502758 RepID=UPI000908AC21|nr:rhodanese-like domain-containing protein [Luteibacter sp. UNCMF366Tsu5.1]SFW74161.1 Rhodanese-related sulfurtransferase [Luteibacter sp. UNCMF366Tsu5.1]
MNDIMQKLPAFASNHTALVAAFVVILIALIAGEVGRLLRKWKPLTPAGLTQLINRDTPLIIDLSASADYEKAHVPGAKNVAMSQFDPETQKDLSKAKDLPVVLVDKDGRGVGKAANRLIKAGFTKVFVLDGGTYAWQTAQLPVAKGKK